MVSIPDWSRFRRGPPPPSPQTTKRVMTPRERYIRAMEKEAISEASRKGYFLEPAKDEIIQEFGDTHGAEDPKTGLPMAKQAWHVNHIRFSYKHMKILGDIPAFSRIVILILDNNYLENIDDLISCRELIKLDIHSNQISVLPDAVFWSQLQKLRILIAHDNPIGRVEAIHSLVACSRLQILTLYDSPLAIKRNYRHHVVNTIWSLKALDHHAVSDEEIIEDAVFKNTRFASKNKVFEIELAPAHPKPGASFESELISIRDLMARVNKIMAHFCPVLIIQKNIRFWLTYRRYRLYVESRIWAAITIQRAWRDYKGLPDPAEEETDLDKILSPLPYGATTTSLSVQQSSAAGTKSSQQLNKDSQSTTRSRISNKIDKHSITSRRSNRGVMNKRALMVDLNKLKQISSKREDSLNAAAVVARVQKMSFKKNPSHVPGTRTIPAPPQPPGRRPLRHQKHFFGPVIKDSDVTPTHHTHCLPDTLPQCDQPYTSQELPLLSSGYKTVEQPVPLEILQQAIDNQEEIPRIGFRLEGQQHRVTTLDPFEDTLLTKREVGQDIRDMETAFHDKITAEPARTREKRTPNIKERFMFERMQQTMALSCLTAVQQAYRDRDLDERRASKMQSILMMKERREIAKERVRAYHEEKRLVAIANHHDDKKGYRDKTEDRERSHIKQIDNTLVRREKERVHRRHREAELKFSQDFTTQQTSVSKALLRHDRQLRRDTKVQRNIEKVEAMKDMEREQQEIVKKYLQHRKMLRQTENAMARAALDTKMLQDANDRVYEAKSRVEHQKSTQEQAKQFTSLPQTAMTVPALPETQPPPSTVRILADPTRNSRRKGSRSMYQFYVPSQTRNDNRPPTRLTMSGGLSRIQALQDY